MISSSIEANNRWILHTQSQESGEDTFRTCSFVITLLKGFRAIINIFSYVIISSKVSNASFAINKFGMIPWAERNFGCKFFRMRNWAYKLFSNFTSILKLTPVKHIKSSNTNESTGGRRFGIRVNIPAKISCNSWSSLKVINNKFKDIFSIKYSIANNFFNRKMESILV